MTDELKECAEFDDDPYHRGEECYAADELKDCTKKRVALFELARYGVYRPRPQNVFVKHGITVLG
jgi:hypothetical protein